jgi:hypothetical protein
VHGDSEPDQPPHQQQRNEADAEAGYTPTHAAFVTHDLPRDVEADADGDCDGQSRGRRSQ